MEIFENSLDICWCINDQIWWSYVYEWHLNTFEVINVQRYHQISISHSVVSIDPVDDLAPLSANASCKYAELSIEWIWDHKSSKKFMKENVSYSVISSVPADGLAPTCAGTSAGAVTTKFASYSYCMIDSDKFFNKNIYKYHIRFTWVSQKYK